MNEPQPTQNLSDYLDNNNQQNQAHPPGDADLDKIYRGISQAAKLDFDFKTFKKKMQSPDSRKKLWDILQKNNIVIDELPDFKNFNLTLWALSNAPDATSQNIKPMPGTQDLSVQSLTPPSSTATGMYNQNPEQIDFIHDQPKGDVGDIGQSLMLGFSKLGEGIGNIPPLLYETMANYKGPGGIPTMEEKAPSWLKNNYVKKMASEASSYWQSTLPKYKNGLTDSFLLGDFRNGFTQLGMGIAESLPITLSMMAAGYAEIPSAMSLPAMSIVSAGQNYGDLQQNKKLSQTQILTNAWINGAFEGITEEFGTKQINSVAKNILERMGGEAGRKEIKDAITRGLTDKMEKNFLFKSMMGEGSEEFLNQLANNITDRLTGVKPDQPIFDNNLFDSFIIGAASSGLTTGPVELAQEHNIKQQQNADMEAEGKRLNEMTRQQRMNRADVDKMNAQIDQEKANEDAMAFLQEKENARQKLNQEIENKQNQKIPSRKPPILLKNKGETTEEPGYQKSESGLYVPNQQKEKVQANREAQKTIEKAPKKRPYSEPGKLIGKEYDKPRQRIELPPDHEALIRLVENRGLPAFTKDGRALSKSTLRQILANSDRPRKGNQAGKTQQEKPKLRLKPKVEEKGVKPLEQENIKKPSKRPEQANAKLANNEKPATKKSQETKAETGSSATINKVKDVFNIHSVPISSINTRTEDFQNRPTPYSEETVKNMTSEYDDYKLNPIQLWKDPEDGKLYNITGHSRTEAFKRMQKSPPEGFNSNDFKDIPAQIFEGISFEKAKELANDSNNRGTAEPISSRAKRYRELSNQEGMTKSELQKRAQATEGRNAKLVLKLSALDPKGKAMQMVESINAGDNVGEHLRIASLIGQARQMYPELTDRHEDELFNYINEAIANNPKKFRREEEWKNTISDIINRKSEFGKLPETLNLKNIKPQTDGEKELTKSIKDLENEQLTISNRIEQMRIKLQKSGLSSDEIDERISKTKTYEKRKLIEQELIQKKANLEDDLYIAKNAQPTLFDFLENQSNDAMGRIKKRADESSKRINSLPVDLIAGNLKDYAIIGANEILKGAKTIKEFTSAMSKRFGRRIKKFIDRIFELSKYILSDQRGSVSFKDQDHTEGIKSKRLKSSIDLAMERINEIEQTGENRILKKREMTLLQDKIKNLKRGFKYGQIDRFAEIKDLINTVQKYAQKNLPKDEISRGQVTKLLSKIKKSKNINEIEKVYEQIRQISDTVEKKKIKSKIKKRLDTYKPTKDLSGKISGKLTPETQQIIDEIKKAVKSNPNDVIIEVGDIIENADKNQRELTEKEKAKIEAAKYSNINNMSLNELQELQGELENIYETGKTKRQIEDAKRKKRIDEQISEVLNVLTGGKDLKDQTDKLVEKEKNSFIRNTLIANMGLDHLLEYMSQHEDARPFQGVLAKIGNTVHESRNKENAGVKEYENKIHDKFIEIFGDKKEARKAIREHLKKVNLGEFENLGGKKVKLEMTPQQIYKKYMELEDPSISHLFDAMQYTDNMKNAIYKYLDQNPKLKEWADWQLNEFYPGYYKTINEIFSKRYNINLNFNEKYSPISVAYSSNILEDEDVMDMKASVPTLVNGSLKPRIYHNRELLYTSGDQVLANHIIKMEHFKAWAESMRDLRAIFGNAQVKEAIRQNYGPKALSTLNSFLDDITSGEINRLKTLKAVDHIRKSFVLSKLGFNLSVYFKQLTSLPAYAIELDAKDFSSGVSDFVLKPHLWAERYKLLMSHPSMQARYNKGTLDRDIKFLMSQKKNNITDKQKYVNALMYLTKIGDRAPIIIGGWAVYKTALKNGMSQSEALDEFARVTKRGQQDAEVESLSTLQRGGSWAKLFTMFQTAPNQYFRYEAMAIRNLLNAAMPGKKVRGGVAYNLRVLAITHIVLPTVFQLISNWGVWDDDDQKWAMALGPLSGLLIVGPMAETLADWMKGDRWGMQATPIQATLTRAERIRDKMMKENVDNKDEWEITLQFLHLLNETITGIPSEPVERYYKGVKDYYEGDTKDVRRLLGASKYRIPNNKKDIKKNDKGIRVKNKPTLNSKPKINIKTRLKLKRNGIKLDNKK